MPFTILNDWKKLKRNKKIFKKLHNTAFCIFVVA